ncbi:MAG: dihydrofolate reductase family protein [Jatrophihabitantaceae bacterium]
MARLIYTTIASLDGYVADADGRFDWSAPDEEVHAFVNDQERAIGTYLYGRRMYEVMRAWETMPADQSEVVADYTRIWQSADKIVYSTTLDAPTTARTRLEPRFEADAVRAIVTAADRDLSIGGPGLAAHALHAGLVDEIHLLVCPVVVGGGTQSLPDGFRLDLELLDTRRFGNGVVHLHYRVDNSSR